MFCNLLLIVIHVLLCVWCVGCWLHRIFTWLEIDILYTLAFSQMMELFCSRALWCQWKSLTIRVLGSGWLMEDPHSCSTHEADMFWNVQMSEVFADCVLNFRWVVQFFWLWNVVDWHNAFVIYLVYILWCSTDRDPRTSVRLVRWLLVALRFCMVRDWYTVHSCLFADDGAFLLASTLVPVEEFDDQSAWLRVVNGGSTFLLDAWSRHVLKCSNEWSLCWLCFEFWPSCTILLVVECCRLAQCICYILCVFCYVLLIVIHVLLCVWCVGCWLHRIFTWLENDILYTLAFSQMMELFCSRALWCQRKSLTIRVLGSGWLMEDPHSCSTHEADMFWNVQMSEVFAVCVLNFGWVVQFFWLWNVVDWHNAFVIYFVYILWCSTDRDPRTSVRLARWLLVALRFCIFWRSIYCASLPFRRRWSIHPCEHLGARDRSGSSKCLAQGVWRIYILARRMKQTCFEKVEHGETKSLLSNYSEMFKWVKSFLILFWIFAELYNCWSIVECCRLAQCTWSLIYFEYFAIFSRLWFMYFCAFGALVVDCIASLHV